MALISSYPSDFSQKHNYGSVDTSLLPSDNCIDIKVAQYLINTCEYSLKDYFELPKLFRCELNKATLKLIEERKVKSE